MQRSIFLVMSLITLVASAQEYTCKTIPLWDKNEIPYNKDNIELEETSDPEKKRYSQISEPAIFLYQKNDIQKPGPALLYCPGGGYSVVSVAKDNGESYAKLFFEMGFNVVAVLKYRLPDNRIVEQQEKVPLCDAQMALATLHRNATEWKIDRNKIGVKGASAGGHLAASLNNLTDKIVAPGVTEEELAQAFSILRVPVISFNLPHRHKGSYKRLLGEQSKDSALLDDYSMENQVNKKTPPTFLVYACDDKSVPYQNSLIYMEALKKQGIPYEFVQLSKGGHGFGLNRAKVDKDWIPTMKEWLTQTLEDTVTKK